MDVMDAINLLKKYDLYDDAKSECRRKKGDTAPYDMMGHHDIYCSLLSKKWVEIRNKVEQLQKAKCTEWEHLPNKPLHDDCNFVYICLHNSYCEEKCEFYLKTLKPLMQEMEQLTEAQQVLKDAAIKDYYLK